MNSRVISKTSIFVFVLSFFALIPVSPASATECVRSSTFQNGYVYLAFRDTTTTCTWTIPADATVIDYLLVGGGGSGGLRHGGGGGAGGLIKGSNVSLSGIASLNIKIGRGGAAADFGNFSMPGNPGDTSTIVKNSGSGSFASLAAVGGGAGQAGGTGNIDGGSGGGSQTAALSNAVAGQGNRGGSGSSGSNEWWSGGGGGAGNAGSNGSVTSGGAGGSGSIWISDFTTTIATALGLVQTNQILSNQVYFAGGGGGAVTTNNTASNTPGGGGLGGGGTASAGNNTATSGTANSGGGGGGSGCCNGGTTGAGGSGVALIRYPANSGLTLSINATPIFRASTNIVATANIDGRVTFFANGKVIPGCKNRTTSSKIVTCVWRPSVHGRNSISATITSSTFASYTGSFASSTQTSKRSGPR
jgi:hypothetical protein